MDTPPGAKLDRRFVVTALLLGAIYALIVAAIASFFGKDAAGAAGVALTALGTAIFAKFADLQFPRARPDRSVVFEIPRIRLWVVSLAGLIVFFASVFVMFLIVLGYGIVWFTEHPISSKPSAAEFAKAYGEASATFGAALSEKPLVGVGFIASSAIVYLGYGFLCTRMWPPRSALLYAVFGAAVAQIVPVVVTLVFVVVNIASLSTRDAISMGVLVVCAAIGWYFGVHLRPRHA